MRTNKRVLFPNPSAGFMVTHVYEWGVTSAVRDYQSDILRAMAINYTLVHEGRYKLCPSHPERFLDCFWEDLSGCQAKWPQHTGIRVVNLTQEITTSAVTTDGFPDWLWDSLCRSGWIRIRDGETGSDIHGRDVPNQEQYFQLKVSVLRAILSKRVFRPRAHIRARTNEILRAWQANGKSAVDGVVIHIRRTDKMIDLGPHWHHIEFASVNGVGMLIQTMETRLNRMFDHAVLMSDDPQIQLKGFEDLADAFQSSPKKLTSKQLCDLLGAHQSEYKGHETLNHTERNTLYVSARPVITSQKTAPLVYTSRTAIIPQDIVISEMYAAAHVSDYIIGSGSCGVSQFMARLMGAKHFVGRRLSFHKNSVHYFLDSFAALLLYLASRTKLDRLVGGRHRGAGVLVDSAAASIRISLVHAFEHWRRPRPHHVET